MKETEEFRMVQLRREGEFLAQKFRHDAYKESERFEGNQRDLTLDDVMVIWAGEYVNLFLRERPHSNERLATLRAGDDIVGKVKRWCLKNGYRCSQIVDGKIQL